MFDYALPTDYQNYIHQSKYARWLEAEGRRETWPETGKRYFDFFVKRGQLSQEEADELANDFVLPQNVMPSMRAIMTAGEALALDNVAGFNCAYMAIERPKRFDEMLYILMCGTGVGFSVEEMHVSKLPEIPDEFHNTDTTIKVADSKIGWASSYRELISLLYCGKVPKWDVSRVRAAGTRLKTFGGRASGPGPLEDLFRFTIATFKRAAGRKLTSIECHSLCCKIASIVVVGGVRRSALLSLSNISDDRMRHAKSGEWWVENPHYALANNSACYVEKPDMGLFMHEWLSLYKSKSGERGIFNRKAAWKLIPERRKAFGPQEFGCNPCSEIILRPCQFCNLTEVVIRPTDTLDDLKRKVRAATILGTLQATLTDFRYLSKEWKRNTEEEALLGVSLTGVMDHPIMNGSQGTEVLIEWLDDMKRTAINVNEVWADRLGINPAAAITCNKPSGTVSQFVNCASGIHARHNPHYIRTVRNDKKDPLSNLMIECGVPHETDCMNPSAWVFSFPMAAPDGAICRNDRTAIEQLELWKVYQLNWCEHKPSVTISVKEHEWMEVGAWVWDNFDIVSGISFLPFSEHTYRQAPYQDINQEEYEARLAEMPKILWERLRDFEKEDNTTGSHEYACTGGACEIV